MSDELVFVQLSRLFQFDLEPPIQHLRTEMQIIQELRRLRGMDTHEVEGFKTRNDATLEEIERAYVEETVERMRPEKTWNDIAELLGITTATLQRKREKYDLP